MAQNVAKEGRASARLQLTIIRGGSDQSADDMDTERRAWRAELLERAGGLVAEGHPMAHWWAREYRAEFGHEPGTPPCRLIQGGL
jgi:hypothetical protein